MVCDVCDDVMAFGSLLLVGVAFGSLGVWLRTINSLFACSCVWWCVCLPTCLPACLFGSWRVCLLVFVACLFVYTGDSAVALWCVVWRRFVCLFV